MVLPCFSFVYRRVYTSTCLTFVYLFLVHVAICRLKACSLTSIIIGIEIYKQKMGKEKKKLCYVTQTLGYRLQSNDIST